MSRIDGVVGIRIDRVVGIRIIVIVYSEVNLTLMLHPTVQTTNMKDIVTSHRLQLPIPCVFILGLKESQMTSR